MRTCCLGWMSSKPLYHVLFKEVGVDLRVPRQECPHLQRCCPSLHTADRALCVLMRRARCVCNFRSTPNGHTPRNTVYTSSTTYIRARSSHSKRELSNQHCITSTRINDSVVCRAGYRRLFYECFGTYADMSVVREDKPHAKEEMKRRPAIPGSLSEDMAVCQWTHPTESEFRLISERQSRRLIETQKLWNILCPCHHGILDRMTLPQSRSIRKGNIA